jgi:RimJ/RimL family protein N-acetyltransferase
MVEQETDRLLLRQWRAEDFEIYAAYFADENTAKYVGGVTDREQAWRRLASYIGHWELMGFGYWAVEEKKSRAFVGAVGLWFSDGWPELELGYWLMPTMYGKGYATEAGIKSRDYAWEVVCATSLVSYIHPENVPSKKVAARLGATFEKTIELLEHGPHCVYRYPKP